MSDLFQDNVSDEVINAAWSVMNEANWHTYQILTKRPERMRDFVSKLDEQLPHVWLGTSVENVSYVHRIDTLRSAPAYVRFVSFDPCSGPVVPVDPCGIHWAIVGGESGPGSRSIEKQMRGGHSRPARSILLQTMMGRHAKGEGWSPTKWSNLGRISGCLTAILLGGI